MTVCVGGCTRGRDTFAALRRATSVVFGPHGARARTHALYGMSVPPNQWRTRRAAHPMRTAPIFDRQSRAPLFTHAELVAGRGVVADHSSARTAWPPLIPSTETLRTRWSRLPGAQSVRQPTSADPVAVRSRSLLRLRCVHGACQSCASARTLCKAQTRKSTQTCAGKNGSRRDNGPWGMSTACNVRLRWGRRGRQTAHTEKQLHRRSCVRMSPHSRVHASADTRAQ